MVETFDSAPDTTYLSELDLQTLAEDQRYKGEILARRPTVFFRPDDRTSSTYPTFWRVNDSGTSYIGFITKYSSHDRKQPPELLRDRIPVKVLSRDAKKISEITLEECSAAYQELSTPKAVQEWLSKKYNTTLSSDSLITVYKVEYLEPSDLTP